MRKQIYEMILGAQTSGEATETEGGVMPLSVDADADTYTSYSWSAGTMSNTSTVHYVGTTVASDGTVTAQRTYFKFTMPTLPRNPRIKKAELVLTHNASTGTFNEHAVRMGIYKVTGTITTGSCTPTTGAMLDYEYMKLGSYSDSNVQTYTFDITSMLDDVLKSGSSTVQLMVRALNESATSTQRVTIFGGLHTVGRPLLRITYESGYGVNTEYRSHTHELGRFGQANVDLQCGNLMFDAEDFVWSGNRKPVTLRHLYNSAIAAYAYTKTSNIALQTADFSTTKLGYGWKLNVMQSMVAASFTHEGTDYEGYVYVDENGAEHFLKQSEETRTNADTAAEYNLYEDVEDGSRLYDPVTLTMEEGEEKYLFDSAGRLVKITDAYGNAQSMTYTSSKLTKVTDGAGRAFACAYNSSGYLSSITAPDGSKVTYAYSGNLLSSITYPDGSKTTISYTGSKPTTVILLDADGTPLRKVTYAYSGDRISTVTEFGYDTAYVQGASSAYAYNLAARKTTVTTTEPMDTEEGETEDQVISTVYSFDDDGQIIGEYLYTDVTGNIPVEGDGSGVNPYAGENGIGVERISNNFLTNHGFDSVATWTAMSGSASKSCMDAPMHEKLTRVGTGVVTIRSTSDVSADGCYQDTMTLPVGEYTYSAYFKVSKAFTGATNPGAYIRVANVDGTVLAESEHLTQKDSEFVRVETSFALSEAQSVRVYILVNGIGATYVDAVQLEDNPYAGPYNHLTNNSFENGITGWTNMGGSTSGTPPFDITNSLRLSTSMNYQAYAYQDVDVKSAAGTKETFTLSGWAKANALPERDRGGDQETTFRLRAVITYADGDESDNTETFTADFSPCTEEWQKASVTFCKSQYRKVDKLTVWCDFDYNNGPAYFDCLQLIRDSIETDLGPSDFWEETEVEEDVVYIEDEDAEDDTTPVFEEAYDEYGNALTETTFTDGEFGTIYRAFGYNAADTADGLTANAGNDLVRETDGRGNDTTYTVDPQTSRNEEVTDRLGHVTAYEYDANGRTAKVTRKNGTTECGNISYTYDSSDNMTAITRGDGMQYDLGYNAFGNLASIGVKGKTNPLVSYTYRNGNGRLKEVTYANGDTMKLTYNRLGQITSEKWYDSADTVTAHYKYVYDDEGNVLRSIDILLSKEYNYSYEDGRIVRSTENEVTLDTNGMVTGRTVRRWVRYYYDAEGTLTKKVVHLLNGRERVYYYENSDDGDTVVKMTVGDGIVTSHSATDSFGRKVFDEIQMETGYLSRQFSYHLGEATEEHVTAEKLKSSSTTQLVSRMVLSEGTILDYEYDAEEHITKVVETSPTGTVKTTEYTYDVHGQLLTETVDGTVLNTMTYDNYGNIQSKNGVTYTYDDSNWKDLLTGYGSKTISYDAQGNPTNYLGVPATWSKGRQLMSIGGVSYTYNANGIRTGKVVNGVTYTYQVEGSKILNEQYGSTTITPIYDNEDSVCGILHNETPLFFLKNLQGDVIAITNKQGEVLARYTYDAWGKVLSVTNASGVEITAASHIAHKNPYRYRGYYYDIDTGLYYLQSRYYDPAVGRFMNADDAQFLGVSETVLGYNLLAYCENDPVNMVDMAGFAAINAIFAVVGGVVGWQLGDYVAKQLGYCSGWKYRAIRAGVIAGGTVIGWFAGSWITKILATYLRGNPEWVLKMFDKHGAAKVASIMEFLGINPFSIVMDSSKFVAMARKFNTKTVTIGYDWAVKLYYQARKFGYKISLDIPHGDYSWHIHVNRLSGKLVNLHIQIVKKAWDYLAELLK